MKKYLFLLFSLLLLSSCGGGYEECPEITKGYARKFIMPSPVVMNGADKKIINDLYQEYNESIANEENENNYQH